ncbi:N-succinylglutamate 5-semialdehyde dehydrogenase [Pseudomonas fluorescens]|uniref:N-succinylglutamate 5-semialdehyde dehydrogenase n=1 Tax=Pseudomonas fluorescens TaxID=294 RepID=A0A5E7V3A9_PSEFL|nr:N-succinylglutamate 5-semialdehyde dehydrogenase [Pseudomonas fluorescens]
MALQPCKNYIAGHWCDGQAVIANHSPSDVEDIVGHYHQASAEQTLDAIAAAREAQPLWAATGLEQRQQVLMAIGNELMARKDELGELLSREEGKPLAEGIGEVNRSAQFFHYYAAEVLRQMGETAASVRPGIEIEVQREPVGVVGIITLEFPDGDRGLEDCPGPGLRQRRGVQTGQPGAGQRLGPE